MSPRRVCLKLLMPEYTHHRSKRARLGIEAPKRTPSTGTLAHAVSGSQSGGASARPLPPRARHPRVMRRSTRFSTRAYISSCTSRWATPYAAADRANRRGAGAWKRAGGRPASGETCAVRCVGNSIPGSERSVKVEERRDWDTRRCLWEGRSWARTRWHTRVERGTPHRRRRACGTSCAARNDASVPAGRLSWASCRHRARRTGSNRRTSAVAPVGWD